MKKTRGPLAFGVCFGLGFAMLAMTSHAAPTAPPVENTKPPKPAAFLQAQIGGMVKIVPDGQAKSAMQQFLEELVALDDRTKAPGRWIDELPVLRPAKTKTDLARLSDQDLYSNLEAANAHWPDFQKRNPKTAAQLVKLLGRPQVRALPKNSGGSIFSTRPPAGKRSLQEDFDAFVEDWQNRAEAVERGSDQSYFQAIGEMALYADFLAAHGDATGKDHALELLDQPNFIMDLFLKDHAKDRSLAVDVGMELILPLMDARPEKFASGRVTPLLSALKSEKRDQELNAVRQWIISQEKCGARVKEVILLERAAAYGALKDGVGTFINLHAAFATRTMDKGTWQVAEFALQRRFGPKQGHALALRYLTLLPKPSVLPKTTAPPRSKKI